MDHNEELVESFLEASLKERVANAFLKLVGSYEGGISVYARTLHDVPSVLSACLFELFVHEEKTCGILDVRVTSADTDFLRMLPYSNRMRRYLSRRKLTWIIRRLIESQELEILSAHARGHDRNRCQHKKYIIRLSAQA